MSKEDKLTTLGQLLKQFMPDSVVEQEESNDPDIAKAYEVSRSC